MPPVPIKKAPPAPPISQVSSRIVQFQPIQKATGHRIVLYGPGGIGKTTLGVMAPGPVVFIDSDESLPRLRTQLTERGWNPPQVAQVNDWQSLRAALQSEGWGDTKTIVLDSITKIEEWAVTYTLDKVKHEKGHKVDSIEGYGYGKGYQHVFDTFLPLLGDLDRLCRRGVNVLMIAHECVANVPNPEGDDWIRYEPRLQNPTSGKASIRLRIKEWADHVLFLGYDVAVEGGVGKGSGTRTIYTSELPFCMAKSRTTQGPIPLVEGESIWPAILK